MKSSTKKSPKGAQPQNSLVSNINRRKKAGKSRSKKDSTISQNAYSDMQQGWPQTPQEIVLAKILQILSTPVPKWTRGVHP